MWSAPGFDVRVTQGSDNKVEVSNSGYFRSRTINSNQGIWWSGISVWTSAHEAGHMMFQPDAYQMVAGKAYAFPGQEGSMMGQANGVVTAAERQMVAKKCGCGK